MTTQLTRTFLPAPPPPAGRPNLVLAGFMGTGKTAAGRRAAVRLGLPFVDADELAVRRAGRSIAEIFRHDGEAAFRRLEGEILRDLAVLSGTVIATGGGAVLHREAFAALAQASEVAVLTAAPTTLTTRLGTDAARPLLPGDRTRELGWLLEQRAAVYAAAGPLLDTTDRSPDEVAAELASRYSGRAATASAVQVDVPAGERSYPVLVGAGAVDGLGQELARLRPATRRVVVVVDERVDASVGEQVSRALADGGIGAGARCRLPAGEAAKTVSCLELLWNRFRDDGLDRSGAVVAVGGGAALDTAGFAAATFARGVPLVNVPTTLLAAVDAALGGKVAIDHAGVKNLVGAFHNPCLVAFDISALATLPGRVLRAGLAECVKAAVLASPVTLELLAAAPVGSASLPLEWIVEQSVRIKAGYVGADPHDHSLRQALNLGHTFGHAIEAASDYAVPHGETVAIGLLAAARLGTQLGVTDPALPDALHALLDRLRLPDRPPPGLAPERLRAALAGDKKRRSGRPVVILPRRGGAELVEGLAAADLVAVLTSG